MISPETAEIIATQLRTASPDRYAATLVLPPEHRAAVQSIYAFAADVAAIRERVRDPAPGEIRLQWWSDTLEGHDHGAVRQNPIADALLATLSTYGLPAGPLVRLVAARRFDLYGDPMPDFDQFEGYAGETVSILYQYAAMILAGGTDPGSADAAGHLGVADAVAGHLRAFGFNAARGQIFLPLSVFTAHGVREGEIVSGHDSPRLRAALVQIAETGADHLGRAYGAVKKLPKSVRMAFAPSALIRHDLARDQSGSASPFSAPQPRNGFLRLARLAIWSMRA